MESTNLRESNQRKENSLLLFLLCVMWHYMWNNNLTLSFQFINEVYILDRWFTRLNGFTLVTDSLLFGVSQGSVLKAVPWPMMIYFYILLFGWRVVSLALIPHLPISISFWKQIAQGNTESLNIRFEGNRILVSLYNYNCMQWKINEYRLIVEQIKPNI